MRTILIVGILLFWVCLAASPVIAQEVIQVVEKDGEAVLGEDTTPAQARAQALNNARRAAIEEAAGVRVTGATAVYNYQVVSDFVASAARGVIVKEELLRDEIDKQDKALVALVRIRAHVKPLEQRDTNSPRILDESVARYGMQPMGNGVVFQDNDEIQVSARVSAPAYLHIFSIDRNGMVNRLFPNDYFKGERVAPGTVFTFPSELQRDMGLKLRVRGAKGIGRTPETMLIVATRDNVDLLVGKKCDELTVTDLMSEVTELDTPWGEKVIGYEIRR